MSTQVNSSVAGSARWFLWIGGCTLVNIFCAATNSNMRLALGANMVEVFAQIFYSIAPLPELGRTVGLWILGILGAGVYFLLSIPASRGKIWAFILGMGLFGIDTIFSLWVQDWIGIFIHAWALWGLFGGIGACLAPPAEGFGNAGAAAAAPPEAESGESTEASSAAAESSESSSSRASAASAETESSPEGAVPDKTTQSP